MKRSSFRTIRWQFIGIILFSLGLSAATVGGCYTLFYFAVFLPLSEGRRGAFAQGLFWLVNNVGSLPFLVPFGCALFLLYFFLLSRKPIQYIEEITAGLQEIAKGDLSHKIAKRSSDELGIVADAVNSMAEQLRRSIEEERSAEKAKRDLITGVSHDLRTPLTSILGFLEYIEDDRYKDEVELRYYLSIVHEKSQSLKKLIDDLFEFTRTSGKRVPLRLAPLNVTDFLSQLAEEFVPLLQKERMIYRVASTDHALTIQADADELVRAYENLISNAIRYGKSGGQVRIEISSEGEEAVVRIINYGEEIPERDIPFLFDRFYRVDRSRSRETGGTGLGLAIVKNIVELHNGRVFAQSDAKETAFETRFPRYVPNAENEPSRSWKP
ncbi:ATP-binding protein [Paenibacillus sp.]|uniref:HAMP domain-containing sensor histidine kinase n=1 Tax=Paenibacillus sp. TaxID=58172 RepID=UPI0028112348|nr:ATP-binding protein [Paenibacillus sp.]